MKKITLLLIFLFLCFNSFSSHGLHSADKKEWKLVNFLIDHVTNDYEWHLFNQSDGSHVSISLPRIIWNSDLGKLEFYTSTHSAEKSGNYLPESDFNEEVKHGFFLLASHKEKLEELKTKLENSADTEEKAKIKAELMAEISAATPLDFSISKNVFFMLLSFFFLIWIFVSIGNKYRRNPNSPPKGLQSFLEPVIVFVRDEIAKPNIQGKFERFLPLLLTFFFFILFLNLLGMIPFFGSATGNLMVTAALSIITFIVVNVNGSKSYWGHIFWFPGIPVFIKPIMLIVEFASVFTKPFALTIRLFANMTAGHIVLLSFISLIFVFSNLGEHVGLGFGISIGSIAFALFIDILELLVAFLQAYIFTLLSAVFIGQSTAKH